MNSSHRCRGDSTRPTTVRPQWLPAAPEKGRAVIMHNLNSCVEASLKIKQTNPKYPDSALNTMIFRAMRRRWDTGINLEHEALIHTFAPGRLFPPPAFLRCPDQRRQLLLLLRLL